GSYYPFTRVHAMKPFDHVCWKEEYGSDACDIQRESALTKYRMIALMYSEMLKAHVQGGSIVRPLQADWPQLTALYDTDQVFSYGGYLIGAPLVHSEMSGTTVITLPYETYSPISTVSRSYEEYYDFITLSNINCSQTSETDVSDGTCSVTVDASYGSMPLFVRAGSIIPTQSPQERAYTTFQESTLNLLSVMTAYGSAKGEMYLDSGKWSNNGLNYANVYVTVSMVTYCDGKGTCTFQIATSDYGSMVPSIEKIPSVGTVTIVGDMLGTVKSVSNLDCSTSTTCSSLIIDNNIEISVDFALNTGDSLEISFNYE
ncbi:Glycoside hydrolase family 31 like protein, partial [Aduncisulcus paluster]